MASNIQIFGIPFGLGGPHPGCEVAPNAMRVHGLTQALRSIGHYVEDNGDLSPVHDRLVAHPNSAIRSLGAYHDLVAQIFALKGVLETGPEVPIFVGGDHCIAAGTIPLMATQAKSQGRKFYVIWIDAHCDLHTLASSTSGNLHGTPMAYCLGHKDFEGIMPRPLQTIALNEVFMIGARDYDQAETRLLETTENGNIDPNHENHKPLICRLSAFLEKAKFENAAVHVSLDLDAFDASLTPAVNTPVSGGLMKEEAIKVAENIGSRNIVTSLDIVEFNPTLNGSDQTAIFAIEIVKKLLS